MAVTLRQLSFLVTLADAGSFRAAAEAACVTQPSLSAAIKSLETSLGAQLVERNALGAKLTPAGEEAVRRARSILNEADDLSHAVGRAGRPLSGAFRLGIIPTIAPFVLPRSLSALAEAYPCLQLSVREDLTDRLFDAVRHGDLDAAMVGLPASAPHIVCQPVASDEFLLAAREGHPLLSAPKLTPDDVAGETLLLLGDGHCLREHVLAACSEPGRRAPFAATSLHTLLLMAAQGMGLTLAPRIAVDADALAVPGLATRRFDPPLVGREIGLAWREGSARAEEVRLLASFFAELLAPADDVGAAMTA